MAASKSQVNMDIWAPTTFTLNPDPRTGLADLEVQKILHLRSLAEKLPDAFTNTSRILRNPLPGTRPSPLSILSKPSSPKSKKCRIEEVTPRVTTP